MTFLQCPHCRERLFVPYVYERVRCPSEGCRKEFALPLQMTKTQSQKYKRIPFLTEVEAESEGTRLPCRSLDLSLGGMYLDTKTVLPANTLVRVSFQTPSGQTVSLEGLVRHAQTAVGMGVEFLPMRQEIYEILAALIS